MELAKAVATQLTMAITKTRFTPSDWAALPRGEAMNKIGHTRLARRTVVAATCAAAALVACSGFAFAATNGAGQPG